MAPQMRKAADVPSKEKNEYIPSFISKKPIWLGPTTSLSEPISAETRHSRSLVTAAQNSSSVTPAGDPSGDYLSHQRAISTFTETSWYDRSKSRLGPAATKYRKGACENCGAMGHKQKDCLQKKRRAGARWTGRDIRQDEAQQEVKMGWDAKRDRWNGFEAEEYDGVVNEYRALEELKKIENSGHNGQQDPDVGDAENASHSLVAAPEERYQEESDMGRNQSNSTRQLRIREDTAKYLINLDLDSARYDPKTRSMVDGGAMEDQSSKLVQEEGFVRGSGEAGEFARAQRYAWEVQEGLIIPGSNESRDGRENFPSNSIAQMHLQANPTEGEYLRRQAIETANKRKSEHKKALHEKYGTDPKASTAIPLLTGVTENEQYVEYDDDGEIKNAKIDIKQSQYEENILVGNHTRVWGSFWEDFRWGFACCQQMEKRSYCTGQKGIEAKIEANDFAILESRMLQNGAHHAHPSEEPFEDQESSARGSVGQRGGPDEDRARKRTWEPKKRTLEEMRSGIDEKELDEWRKKRAMGDDPMSKFLGSDEVAPV